MAKGRTIDVLELNRLIDEAWQHKEYEKAIDLLTQTISHSAPEEQGSTWAKLGKAYEHTGKHDDAIACYQKSILTEGFDGIGHAWNNMGLAYKHKGEIDRAIECYQKALDIPGYDTPGETLFNMGVAYSDKEDHDRAIECYWHALTATGVNVTHTIVLLGQAYFAKKNYKLAEIMFKHASSIRDLPASFPIKSINDLLTESVAKAKKSRLSSSEELAVAIIKRIIPKLPRSEGQDFTPVEQHITQLAREVVNILKSHAKASLEYCAPPTKNRKAPVRRDRGKNPGIQAELPQDYFLNLKAWSSNLPLMAGYIRERFNGRPVQGGGYFVRWRGKGIAIDPGLNFIENLHSYQLHLTDINLVIVTHCHIDHNNDLPRLVDLQREYNATAKKGNRHEIVFFLDNDTYTKLWPQLKDEGRRSRNTHVIRADTPIDLKSDYGLILHPFETKHGDSVPDSVGLVLELHGFDSDADTSLTSDAPFLLGLSSDTALTDQVIKALKPCHAIVAHFSKTGKHDLRAADLDKRLDHHLGYMGVRELFQQTQAKLCIAAEWSGDKGDMRYQLTELWRTEITDTSKSIIPSDIGLLFSIPGMKIRCRACQRMVERTKIIVGRPDMPFGRIMYYCEGCLGKDRRD